jgi:protein involved in polysaccharide export with SLBB domain
VLTLLLAITPGVVLSQRPPHSENNATATQAGLGAGDFVAIKIWREPDLSDTVQVDNDGIAVFPKLGPIEVTGILPDSLARLLVREYSRYLQNPSIRIAVLRRIPISGAVQKPGIYPVDLTMSIADAIALAGGATSEGKQDQVELRRGAKRYMVALPVASGRLGELSLRSGDQLFVPQRSWFSRNTGLIIAAIGTATSIAYFVARY